MIFCFRKGKDETQENIRGSYGLSFFISKQNIFHSIFQTELIWQLVGAGNLWRSHLTLSNLKKKMFDKWGDKIYSQCSSIDKVNMFGRKKTERNSLWLTACWLFSLQIQAEEPHVQEPRHQHLTDLGLGFSFVTC